MSDATLAWRSHLYERYRLEADLALAHFLQGKVERPFIERIVAFLQSYVELPRGSDASSQTDLALLLLARALSGHLFTMVYAPHLTDLWPRLCTLAAQHADPNLYLVLAKHLPLINGLSEGHHAGLRTYQSIIDSPYFSLALPSLQVDLLVNYATQLLWHGESLPAAELLHRCLTLTATASPLSVKEVYRQDHLGLRLGDWVATLWELRAYTLNQLGVLQMFQGDFAAARQYFDACLTIFVEQGEADNLACVAYQAIGRLLLYQGHYSEAVAELEKGLLIRQRRQETDNVAINQVYLAAACLRVQQLERASALLAAAQRAYLTLKDQHDLALCKLYLGALAWQRGQRAEACEHWQTTAMLATTTVLHFVELRPWIRYLLPLLACGEFALCRQLLLTLWQGIRHDQLTVRILWRFLWV